MSWVFTWGYPWWTVPEEFWRQVCQQDCPADAVAKALLEPYREFCFPPGWPEELATVPDEIVGDIRRFLDGLESRDC